MYFRSLADSQIMQAFLEGYDYEMQLRESLIRDLNSEARTKKLASFPPEVAMFYEGKTKKQMQAEAPQIATAWGVAAAVRVAFETIRSITPISSWR